MSYYSRLFQIRTACQDLRRQLDTWAAEIPSESAVGELMAARAAVQ